MKFSILLTTIVSTVAAASTFAAAPVTLTVTPESEAVHPGSRRDTVVQIEVRGRPSTEKRRTPLNLALVIDRSGSMSGAKIEKARQAAAVAVDQLGADDFFSLVAYDDEVRVIIPAQKIGDDDSRAEMKAKIHRLEPGGSTALHAGVTTGAEQLREILDDEKVSRVILLSDGLANVGPSSPGELAKLGKSLRRDGISVSTIGLGDDYNEDLMTALAEASHANYYYVRDAEKLPGIFKEELGSVKSIVARRVELVIELATGVEVREVLGEDNAIIEGRTVRIPVEDLAGSQTRRFLLSCRIPAEAEESISLGTVELACVDPLTGNAWSDQQSASVRVAATREEADGTLSKDVASNNAILQNRLAKERAVALADAGRPEEAVAELRRQRDANAALPAAARSPALKAEQEVLSATAAELSEGGSLSKSSRKEIQYQNYQDKKQKR